jgi:biotin operon repressor
MSGTQRLLDRLSDGKFHSHDTLYRDLGVMVHSRVADLRRKGYVIHVRRQWDKHQRRNYWYYRLASNEPSALPGEGHSAPSLVAEAAADGSLGARTTAMAEGILSPDGSLSPPSQTTPATSSAEPETRSLSLFDMPKAPAWG